MLLQPVASNFKKKMLTLEFNISTAFGKTIPDIA